MFKVETIGDCYLAVTGVPKPQSDHAVRIIKFALECMVRMKDLICTLADTLGGDTINLSFRVGIHSGEVTAGVLRGERARFQLFGDTVNTASRMESNGIRGRIHCSQTTADKLIMANKQHWLMKRSKMVDVKGKGKMQTFWVHPRALTSSGSGSGSDIVVGGYETSKSEFDPSQTADDETEITQSEAYNMSLANLGRTSTTISEINGDQVLPEAADSYANASVLFGKVTGFSTWMTDRKPQEIFDLLGTIYKEFDTIAAEFGVLKVETIANCYVAVVGILYPCPYHALVASQFASACITRMKALTVDLEKTFGEDTSTLSFQVGINSGEIIAGVLKTDQRSRRLQLFGPNVDLAARLQNKGIKGQIVCSKATRDNLVASGKSSWVLPLSAEQTSRRGISLMLETFVVVPSVDPGQTQSEGSHQSDHLD